MTTYKCRICGYNTKNPKKEELGSQRGNTQRFISKRFNLWKCPKCNTIHTLGKIDFKDIYSDYPLNNRKLDFFAYLTLNNLFKRLKKAGLKKTDYILDYGCGNGLFVNFLKNKGYNNAEGYDPYVHELSKLHNKKYDWVITNDTIEHVENHFKFIKKCIKNVKKGGKFYIGTLESDGINMDNLDPHIMRLHLPFHRLIFTQKTLRSIVIKSGLKILYEYKHSYLDTLIPFGNYRFLNEYSKALNDNMDLMFKSENKLILLKKPSLIFYGFFGYFFPSAYEPAIISRKD